MGNVKIIVALRAILINKSDVYKRQELDGVQSSVVNLMKQTLTIIVAQTAADTIASQIETIVHSHEPDVEVSEIVQESYIPVSYTHLDVYKRQVRISAVMCMIQSVFKVKSGCFGRAGKGRNI